MNKKIKDGVHTEWIHDGKIKREGTYKDGKLNGVFTEYYENGNKKSKGVFKDGKLDGSLRKWYENGNPDITIEYYENGELVHKSSLNDVSPVKEVNKFKQLIEWIKDDYQKKRLISFLKYVFLYLPLMGIPGFFWTSFVYLKILDNDVSGIVQIFYFIGLVPGVILLMLPGMIISEKIEKPFDNFLSKIFNYNEDGSVEE